MESGAFAELEAALAACGGQPDARGGAYRALAALIGAVPLPDEGDRPAPVDRAVLTGIVGALLEANNVDALTRMMTARAEALIPGITQQVPEVLADLGIETGDDGEPEYIFIGGAGRSGTTLLRAMLDAHPRIRCGPELKIIPDLCQMRLGWTKSLGPELEAAGAQPDVLDNMLRATISTLLDGAGPEAPRIAEKTPHNLLFIDLLGRIFPRAMFVHVIRDGRAVAASLVRQKWNNPLTGDPLWYCANLTNAARYWQDTIQAVQGQAGAVPGRYIEVRYERLVADPKGEMRRLLAMLGEPWDAAVLNHHSSGVVLPETETSSAAVAEPLHQKGLNRWRRELGPEEQLEVTEVANNLLLAFGYTD